MRFIFIVFLYALIFNNLYAKTLNELVSKIANSSPKMQYEFWTTQDENSQSKAYVALESKDGGFKVWHFTKERTWQPIHNANKLGIFPKAGKVFKNVIFNRTQETMTFENIISNPTDDDTNKKAKLLENKTFDIGWYFWINTKDAFLFSKNSSNEFHIWHFTVDKKWRPIHNANKIHGFDRAIKAFESVSFTPSTGILTIGKSILPTDNANNDNPDKNKPVLPKGITIISSDVQDGEFLDEQYATSISPSLSWNVNNDIKNKNIIKSYAISLKDVDVNKYHWNIINIPSSITSIPKGARINYENSKNIMNDFGSPSYIGPFPPKGEIHNYEFTVYAFVTASIDNVNDYNYAIYKSSIKLKYKGK